METKRVKQLYLDSERIINTKSDEEITTYDMEKLKEYFVNYTRVVLLANEITNGDKIGKELDKELAELTQQFNQHQKQIDNSQGLMKSYLKEIVNFNQNAKPLIDSMGEYDKQLEQNKEIEQQLAQWQKRFDESVYSTENDLHKEQEKSNTLTAEIEAAKTELKKLKSQKIANEKIKDPILSLFNI